MWIQSNFSWKFGIQKKIIFRLGTELGTVLTVASANDVDTYPSLAYSFDEVHTDEDALALFAIDRFSGKVLLKKPLDYEMRQEYQLKILASDAKYTAQSTLTIHLTDENDNAPIFSQLIYQTTISGKTWTLICASLSIERLKHTKDEPFFY